MKNYLVVLLVLAFIPSFIFNINAQTTVGLVAHYPFDKDFENIVGSNASNGIPNGAPQVGECAVDTNGVFFNGTNDYLRFVDDLVNDEFDTEDFTVSFYFKSIGGTRKQFLLSKQNRDCSQDAYFFILYDPPNNLVSITLGNIQGQFTTLNHRIVNDACWQFLTLLRRRNRIELYINGQFAKEAGADVRVDIMNDGELILGGADQVCLEQGTQQFNGVIDDFKLFNRALDEDEIESLYFKPDQILTKDTIIFLGNSVQTQLSKTCSQNISWTVVEEDEERIISNVSNPLITPSEAGSFVYRVAITDNLQRVNNTRCIAQDSIVIRVIDPSDLDCGQLFLPSAFTPNSDNLNDTYGISNPIAIERLIAFEIFDRWGNRIFFTDDPSGQWDGSYRGVQVNPGVMVYRIQYECEGEEKLILGSFTVLR